MTEDNNNQEFILDIDCSEQNNYPYDLRKLRDILDVTSFDEIANLLGSLEEINIKALIVDHEHSRVLEQCKAPIGTGLNPILFTSKHLQHYIESLLTEPEKRYIRQLKITHNFVNGKYVKKPVLRMSIVKPWTWRSKVKTVLELISFFGLTAGLITLGVGIFISGVDQAIDPQVKTLETPMDISYGLGTSALSLSAMSFVMELLLLEVLQEKPMISEEDEEDEEDDEEDDDDLGLY